jgi:uncharacterized protein YjiS (DUF1127 family)
VIELIGDSVQQLEADARDRQHLPSDQADRAPTRSLAAPRIAASGAAGQRSVSVAGWAVTHWSRIFYYDLFEPAAEAVARDELAAGGGGAAAKAAASFGRPFSYHLYLDAHANCSFALSAIVVAMLQAVWASARRAYARHKQQRRAARTYEALSRLDDHTLRDLGYDRSELRSIAVHASRR